MTTPRRRMQWFSEQASEAPIALSAQLTLNILSGLLADLAKNATITRVLLSMFITPDTIAQVSHTSFGVVLVNSDAAAAGAFPDADDMTDRVDWMMRDRSRNMVSSLSDSSQSWKREYDLRGQRVIRTEESGLYIILDQSINGGVTVSTFSRVLVKFA